MEWPDCHGWTPSLQADPAGQRLEPPAAAGEQLAAAGRRGAAAATSAGEAFIRAAGGEDIPLERWLREDPERAGDFRMFRESFEGLEALRLDGGERLQIAPDASLQREPSAEELRGGPGLLGCGHPASVENAQGLGCPSCREESYARFVERYCEGMTPTSSQEAAIRSYLGEQDPRHALVWLSGRGGGKSTLSRWLRRAMEERAERAGPGAADALLVMANASALAEIGQLHQPTHHSPSWSSFIVKTICRECRHDWPCRTSQLLSPEAPGIPGAGPAGAQGADPTW